MGKKLLITGNEAVGYGAIYAGCRNYFGYPITPQNEVVEFFARELPKIGGNFVQTESELTSINMLYGAVATGVRAMTSSSSTGFSLMQECIAHMAYCSLPAVIVDVQRGGPGAGSTQTAQMDYAQVTKGGGNGESNKRGRGTKKTPVVGMAERDGKIRAKAVKKEKLNVKSLSALVRENIDIKNAILITDEYKGYMGIKYFMPHEVVNHTEWYVNGNAHTNTIESFWALLKRGIVGQYHKVSLRYLPKYIDEFCYRQNNRKKEDLFGLTLQRAVGV